MTIRSNPNLNGAFALTDASQLSRLYDAWGANVVKFLTHYTNLPIDDTTLDPTEYTATMTEVGAGDTIVSLDTTVGGRLLITTAANEDDGVNLQLNGEAFTFATNSITYFGIKFKVSDATQSDFLAGLCITDTTLLGGMTDGCYFRSADGSATVSFVLEKDSTETSTTAITTMSDATDYIMEFIYDGRNGTIRAWTETGGVLSSEIVPTTTANLPNDEVLTYSFAYLTGAAGVDTASIDWVRIIQIG